MSIGQSRPRGWSDGAMFAFLLMLASDSLVLKDEAFGSAPSCCIGMEVSSIIDSCIAVQL